MQQDTCWVCGSMPGCGWPADVCFASWATAESATATETILESAAAWLTLASLLQEPAKAIILFHGLCVRMGLATGKVETTQVGSNIPDLTCSSDGLHVFVTSPHAVANLPCEPCSLCTSTLL